MDFFSARNISAVLVLPLIHFHLFHLRPLLLCCCLYESVGGNMFSLIVLSVGLQSIVMKTHAAIYSPPLLRGKKETRESSWHT
jgi:hypothetical protein